MLFGIIAAGGALYMGLKVFQSRGKKETSLSDPAQEGASKKKNQVQSLVSKVDDKYQDLIHRKIDPLFGGKHHEQMGMLGVEQEEVGEEEKTINRELAFSSIAMCGAVIGTFFYPPLVLLSAATAFYGILPLYKDAYNSVVKERRVKNDLVIGIYLAGMLATGYYALLAITSCFYCVGSKLKYRTEDRSRKQLVNVFSQQPRFVWRLVDGVEIETPLGQLQSNDKIVVSAGEIVPVDGTVLEGIGSADQHILTGEAQAVEKEKGDAVFASTLLLTGRLTIQVEKAGSETTAAHIGKVLNEMADFRGSMESKGVALGNKTALPLLITSGLAYRFVGKVGATAILGNGFGLNMDIIAPLSMLNFLNLASKKGILVKDGRALERLKDVDTFVFDKTGTLTLDEPHVANIYVHAPLSEDELLTYAAAAEHRQTHPIAKAIQSAAKERELELPKVDEARYEVGFGIKVEADGRLVRVGSERFMITEGIEIPTDVKELKVQCHSNGGSLILVSLEDELAGAIEMQSTIRPEAKEIIEDLHKRNISVSIISGDQEEPTRKLAKELGIDQYFANTLPENKAKLIEELQEEGHSVCFIGDGINDAIALKQADVSMSLLGATSVATDTAQIVLMDKSLTQIPYLLDLTKKLDKTIRNGFLTTIVPGVICIGGVFFLHFGLVAAEALFLVGLYSGLGVAMKPLFTLKKKKGSGEI